MSNGAVVKIFGDGELDAQSRHVLATYKQAPFLYPYRMTPDEMRRSFDEFYEPIDLPKAEVERVEDRAILGFDGSTDVRIYHPRTKAAGALPICLYYHGGGLAFGSVRSYDSICRRFCHSTQAIVIFVAYRLIPEHKFPSAPDDAYASLRWAHDHAAELGGDPSRVAAVGDSAGGNLVAVTAQRARADGPRLALQVMIYPAVGSRGSSESAELYSSGYFFEPDGLQWFYDSYLERPEDVLDARVSPILAEDLSGLAPAFILTAGFDGLRDDAEHYGHLIAQAGVPTEIHRYSSNLHGFLNMGGIIDNAAVAIDDCAAMLRAAFGTAEPETRAGRAAETGMAISEAKPEEVERVYVTGLTNGDVAVIDRLLSDDFIMIDTMSGSEVPKAMLIALLADRTLRFHNLDLSDVRVRRYGDVAVVSGASSMIGSYQDVPFEAKSRYTHIMHLNDGRWRIVAAQGTKRQD